MEISIFENIFQSKDGGVTSIDEFLNSVKFGKWEEITKKINSIQDKEQRQKEKKKVPYVTVSGLFNHRKDSEIIQHSGFICIDVDNLDDVQGTIEKVTKDHFVYSCFKSISGKGIAIIIKIDPKKHLESFLGLESYFINKYQINIDRSCKDSSRARFASFDPNLYINPDAKVFKKYIPKSKKIPKNKLPNVIIGNNDIDHILEQISSNSIDITNSQYDLWLQIGFAISEEFGEMGRSYFHAISYNSDKYDHKRCDKQYDHCLRSKNSGITFATFLYHCKNANISIVSPETKHIVTVSSIAKSSGRGITEIVKTLKEVDGYSEEITKPIVKKVLARDDVGENNKLSKLESIEIFLNSNYNLKRNEVTRVIENGNEEVDSQFFNSTYIKARKEVDDKIKYEEIDRLIGSDFVESYNPLKDFFENNSHLEPSGNIKKLADSINSKNEYKELFLTKWLVGIVESIYGGHSPLLLALTGGQQTGKTEFFRRLLPEEFKPYYAESKLDAGKDDEILMTQKIIILDDEFGGKSKAEAKRLKEITSKQYFTLREPYGRRNVRLRRLSVLAGTSNDEKLLNDPTGNRRIIPIHVDSMNFDLYNSIDKKELFVEVFNLWQNGYKWQTTKEEVQMLKDGTSQFEQVVIEKELILRYYKLPEQKTQLYKDTIKYLQTSEIKADIERKSLQRINLVKLVAELKRLGFKEEQRNIFGNTRVVYPLIEIEDDVATSIKRGHHEDDEKVENLAF